MGKTEEVLTEYVFITWDKAWFFRQQKCTQNNKNRTVLILYKHKKIDG